MCAFRDAIPEFDELDADIHGFSVDLPFAQNVQIEQHDLGFPMLSDWNHEVIHAYDVVRDDLYGSIEAARRSVSVLDADGVVRYRWLRDGDNPDFEAFTSTVHEEVAAAARS